MKVPIYNLEKKQTEEITVSDGLFNVAWKPALVQQAIVTQLANNRQKTAKTKDRSEVRGGGKKPWRQKGTGRARHGSIRSPIWIGGGVTHGPIAEKSYEKKINKKMRVAALLSLMSKKFSDGKVLVLEGITPETFSKTKELSTKTKNLRTEFGSIMVVTSSKDKKVFLAARNVPKLTCVAAKSLSIVDVARPNALFITKQAIPELTSHFIVKEKSLKETK